MVNSEKLKEIFAIMEDSYLCFLDLIGAFSDPADLKASVEALLVVNDYALKEASGEKLNGEKFLSDLKNCGLSEQNFQKLDKLIDNWTK